MSMRRHLAQRQWTSCPQRRIACTASLRVSASRPGQHTMILRARNSVSTAAAKHAAHPSATPTKPSQQLTCRAQRAPHNLPTLTPVGRGNAEHASTSCSAASQDASTSTSGGGTRSGARSKPNKGKQGKPMNTDQDQAATPGPRPASATGLPPIPPLNKPPTRPPTRANHMHRIRARAKARAAWRASKLRSVQVRVVWANGLKPNSHACCAAT